MGATWQGPSRLTRARRAGLAVLATEIRGRRSNFTSDETTSSRRYVYWQTADWLVAQGLATQGVGAACETLTITDAGRELARKEGL